jgi:flavin-dependent dehydrogenase
MDTLGGVSSRYDALVVGARAAGASTALLLARRGLRVLAVDRGAYGADTLSTHALMRAGVLQLARWGLLGRIEAAGTPRVERTVFHYEDEAVDVRIKPRDGVPALYAPRRTLLDRVLVDAAVEAGASVRHGIRVSSLARNDRGRVVGAHLVDADGHSRVVSAPIVIGADGLRSTLAGLVEAPVTRLGRHSTATIYGYWSGLELDGYHWHWRKDVAAGAIPTNDGRVLLFVGVPPWRFWQECRPDVNQAYHRLLAEAAPELAEPLARARLDGSLHGFAGHAGFLRRSWGAGWVLVGDAGYFKDPITAHGLSDALRDAELVADAIARGGELALADYEACRNRLSGEIFEATEAIASFEWDNAALKLLHRRLSDAMKREVQALVALFAERAELVCASGRP